MSIFLALMAGSLVILCISLNGLLAKKVGLIQSGITNYFVGLLCSFIYLLIISGFSLKGLVLYQHIPFYCYLGGVIGSFIMVLNSLVILRLSAVYVTILLFLGQLSTGLVIDFFQKGNVSIGKLIGGFVLLIGLLFYVKGSRTPRTQPD